MSFVIRCLCAVALNSSPHIPCPHLAGRSLGAGLIHNVAAGDQQVAHDERRGGDSHVEVAGGVCASPGQYSRLRMEPSLPVKPLRAVNSPGSFRIPSPWPQTVHAREAFWCWPPLKRTTTVTG